MGKKASATRPVGKGGTQYHIGVRDGAIAGRCILVGDPDRATTIATSLLEDAKLVGDKRGLRSYTGRFMGTQISVVTTGMGGASVGIVLPEAVAAGAKAFVHVGSCGALQRGIKVGSIIICTGAVRLDGASGNWAPRGYPAMADWRMISRLESIARSSKTAHHIGIGATTSCFNEGQARPDGSGYVPPRMIRRHKELVKRGVLFYAMEDAAIFTWCSAHGGIPVGSVNAVFGNRVTGRFKTAGVEDAAYVACMALRKLRL